MIGMTVVINVLYEGSEGAAGAFVGDVVFEELLDAVRSEDGCLGYEYFRSMESPDRVLLVEHWRDESALDAHIAAENLARIQSLKVRHGISDRVEKFLCRSREG